MTTILIIALVAIAATIAAERFSTVKKLKSNLAYYNELLNGERRDNAGAHARIREKEDQISHLKERILEEVNAAKDWRLKAENSSKGAATPHLAKKLEEEYQKVLKQNESMSAGVTLAEARIANFEEMVAKQNEIIASYEAKDKVRKEKKKLSMQRSRERKREQGKAN